VNPVLGFNLTLELGPASGQRGQVSENMEALCGEIHEGTLTGGSVAVQEAQPADGNAKVAAWIGHAVSFVIEQRA
jgi:hypothetical protein